MVGIRAEKLATDAAADRGELIWTKYRGFSVPAKGRSSSPAVRPQNLRVACRLSLQEAGAERMRVKPHGLWFLELWPHNS